MDANSVSVLWRRLDTPGHDACRLDRIGDGWRLEGAAVFRHQGEVAQLNYRAECDREWRSRSGHVAGWIGNRRVDVAIARTGDGGWMIGEQVIPEVEGCVDLDLGFTPATNLFPIRRLALTDGQARDAPAAWLNDEATTLQRLPQHYEWRSETSYWYRSPAGPYEGLLHVTPVGFIREYPSLWVMEPAHD
jgi:hypothetical protein